MQLRIATFCGSSLSVSINPIEKADFLGAVRWAAGLRSQKPLLGDAPGTKTAIPLVIPCTDFADFLDAAHTDTALPLPRGNSEVTLPSPTPAYTVLWLHASSIRLAHLVQ